jgi:hypothetical protein
MIERVEEALRNLLSDPSASVREAAGENIHAGGGLTDLLPVNLSY